MRARGPAATLLVVLLTGCSSEPAPTAAPSAAPPPSATASAAPSTTGSAAPAATPTEGPRVTISGFDYVVPPSVRPGERVTVVNEDREAHTVTVDGGAVRLSVLPGATAVFTAPAGAGPHTVSCDLHGGMDAVLVVA